ncbi:MAG: CPXCG motif-containing cysteine-rich protein [Bacteroidota bacterium]|nr:CPXCG motif-containing cysteine-rich protein [Bacteroidota bacterium]MDX5426611.1 CPXCG motif-containing cysteine-rich protein [Bacteroidota bacterium]MDX5447097.1 CPXCG motif-containing cysteine-rich protein [Bacteroidota bacterium]MDX5504620.1 CPXCG motif-containing cysteine-rich protein [Bacteroidota bacterium]
MEEEVFLICPHCFSEISIIVDLSVDEQEYIEDCEVCCNPIEFHVECSNGEVRNFRSRTLEQ